MKTILVEHKQQSRHIGAARTFEAEPLLVSRDGARFFPWERIWNVKSLRNVLRLSVVSAEKKVGKGDRLNHRQNNDV